MALIRYEPWNLLDRLQREFNLQNILDPYAKDLVGDDNSDMVTSHWRPAVDIKEEDDRFVIYVDLPGVDPKDIKITMEQGVLTLKGECSKEAKEERDGYKRVERVSENFYRRFSLPETVDAERIEAEGKNGVLQLTLPKQEKEQARKITVKS